MAESFDQLKNQLEELQQKFPEIQKLSQSLNHRLLELYSLYQIGLALSTTLDLNEIFNLFKKIFQQTLKVDRFGIFLIDHAISVLNLHTSFGLPKDQKKMKTSFKFGEDIFGEAIMYEIERNGQVFFINNRVQNIYEIEALINRACPNVRTVVAHGQMEGKKLEKIMLDFINEEYGVLIATTIIESGLDIPNANTIIINNAQNFGLSTLHQLRGRVGRSNKKAFCYLLAPPLTSVSAEARRRLDAINNFSELGSGFNIALQDLDIRGAGNMLGGEQSGYIADIGFETYHRILDEALLELRENEFKGMISPKSTVNRSSKSVSI